MLGRFSSLARRLYHHHFHGGKLSEWDVSRMVKAIETLEAEAVVLREDQKSLLSALDPFKFACNAEEIGHKPHTFVITEEFHHARDVYNTITERGKNATTHP